MLGVNYTLRKILIVNFTETYNNTIKIQVPIDEAIHNFIKLKINVIGLLPSGFLIHTICYYVNCKSKN